MEHDDDEIWMIAGDNTCFACLELQAREYMTLEMNTSSGQ